MTYNYFNAGRLAFGKKIASAFNSLNELYNSAFEHVDTIAESVSYYAQFVNKNYVSPSPTTPVMPSRTNEIFDLIANTFFIDNISINSNNINISVTIFNNNYSRITKASGITNLKEGYAIAKLSVDLNNFNTDIRFSNTNNPTNSEMTLFKFYRRDNEVLINIDSSEVPIEKGDIRAYKNFTLTNLNKTSYTCNTPGECIIVIAGGNTDGYTVRQVNKNGKVFYYAEEVHGVQNHIPMYLKNGDKVTGTNINSIYKVTYNGW